MTLSRNWLSLAVVVACISVPVSTVAFAQVSLGIPPVTDKFPVADTYHGIKVSDNYRWLENGDDPKVKAWVASQNAHSQEYLSKLPQRPGIVSFLKSTQQQAQVQYGGFTFAGGRMFSMKYDPQKSAATLVTFVSPIDKSSEKVIVDLNTLVAGKTFQASWYKPSLDGTMVGMALGTGGSEDASLYVFDVATGKQIGNPVPRVQFATAGGDMAWTGDGKGFYYTRYPQGTERPAEDADFYQQVFYHALGTPASADRYILGRDFPRIGEIAFTNAHDGQRILVSVEDGDGGKYEHFMLLPDGTTTQIAKFEDKIVDAQFGADDSLWLLSHAKSDRGELDHIPPGSLKLSDAVKVIGPMEGSIEGTGSVGEMQRFWASESTLYVTVIDGGPEEILKFDLNGKNLGKVPVPPVASVSRIVPVNENRFLYNAQTYTKPGQWFEYDGRSEPRALPFKTESKISLDDIEVRREFAISKDGTKVPMTILMRKGTKLDGTNPTLLTGYGGYAISMTPGFIGSFGRMWFDRGGIFVESNLRGGAEYGEGWHTGGNLLNKQHVFDDFYACAQLLVKDKYTSPAHLAIEGGSNGGLLMGAEFTQHPEMFRAVISEVGIYDMLRVELDPNGSFNVTEFGSVKDPALFKAMYAYSPYHHVKPGTKYPAILFVTGDNDHRVNPAHSRKMTAALQAATTSGLPVLLRTNANAGHGISTDKDEALEEVADIYSFLFAQLGLQMSVTP